MTVVNQPTKSGTNTVQGVEFSMIVPNVLTSFDHSVHIRIKNVGQIPRQLHMARTFARLHIRTLSDGSVLFSDLGERKHRGITPQNEDAFISGRRPEWYGFWSVLLPGTQQEEAIDLLEDYLLTPGTEYKVDAYIVIRESGDPAKPIRVPLNGITFTFPK